MGGNNNGFFQSSQYIVVKCHEKKQPRYKLFGKSIVRYFGKKESVPKYLDTAVSEIVNNCCCDQEFCGKYFIRTDDETVKFRLVVSTAGELSTIEVDENDNDVT